MAQMAGSKSDYLETIFLKLVLGAVAFTAPTTLGIALSTAAFSDAATGAAMNEVPNSNAYARVSQTNNSTNWPLPTGTNPSTSVNGTTITFPTATGSWGAVTSVYVTDSATWGAGNCLYGGDLAVSKTVTSGDTLSLASSTGLTVTED